jgi:glycosyltransferase involved in cell wall biosynthesis
VLTLKNVLIITFYFPPSPGIGGVRPYGLAKYLPLYGWNPIFLTPELPGDPDPKICVIQTPYYDVIEGWKRRFGLNPKKALTTYTQIKRKKDEPSIIDRLVFIPNEFITYPDGKIGWYDYAFIEGERIIQTTHIDAILSSSHPETCHLIAKALAEKHHIPWVADFRDLWQNHYSSYSRLKKYFLKNLEIRTLKHASAITTVSQPLVEKLEILHKNKPIFAIKNGFDPESINPENNEIDDYFTIVYTGDLYEGKRDPTQLFAAIHDLCRDNVIKRDHIRIHFFGYPKFEFENWLQEEILKYDLQDLVTLHGRVSHNTAISEQRKAQILLLLMWDNQDEKGVYTGKLFEYLAARRPIISFGFPEGGVVKDLLDQTQAGVHAGNFDELKGAIIRSYQEYKKYGKVQYRGIKEEVMMNSQQEMARNFGKVLDTMIP